MKSSLIYAHRGAKSEFLENTRSAFDRAVELGVDGIETDIQISKDGISVLWHDSHLGKLGRADERLGELDYKALSQLAFSEYGNVVDGESGLVSLDLFLQRFGPSCQLLLEVKNLDWDRHTGRHQKNISQCLEAVKNCSGQEQDSPVVVSSFDLDSLLFAHEKEPLQALVLNIHPDFPIDEIKQSLDNHPFFYGYCFPIDDLNDEACRLVADDGKNIIVYTCNSEIQIQKALDLGVDILISDFPSKALELRSRSFSEF